MHVDPVKEPCRRLLLFERAPLVRELFALPRERVTGAPVQRAAPRPATTAETEAWAEQNDADPAGFRYRRRVCEACEAKREKERAKWREQSRIEHQR